MSQHSWTCFRCRRTIKGGKPWSGHTPVHTCPECGRSMTYMGNAFKSPRRAQDEQWQKVEEIRRAGYVFRNDRGAWPRTLRETRVLLAPREPFPGASLLHDAEERRAANCRDRD